MKSTERLTVTGDYSLRRDHVVIHPNDGYDLGLLARETAVQIHAGQSEAEAGKAKPVVGTLVLENDCTLSTVRLNLALWQDLGRPRTVTLSYESEKLFITRA
jgi:hypothetical protein